MPPPHCARTVSHRPGCVPSGRPELRIAVDARPLASPTTGIGRYTGALLRAWPTSDDTFLLYSHRALPEPSLPAGHVVRHGRLNARAAGTPFAQLNFARWARQDGADLFWSPRHHLPRGLGGLPAVVTIHDLAWKRVPETMRWTGLLNERLLMPSAIRSASAIVTDSESTARDLAEFFPDAVSRVAIIPPASELEPVSTPPVSERPYMLFVGTMEPRKNLERVVQAFTRLHQVRNINHRLVIVGNRGWKDRRIRAMIAESRCAAKIEAFEKLDDDALARLYAGADFLVAPSLYEGFGLQIVEAIAFGIPIITSDRASLPEVAGDAALLVDPLSVDAMQAAMQRLISDREERDRLAHAARERAKRFSWKTAAIRLRQVFQTVIPGLQEAFT